MREAVGDGIDIMVDCHARPSPRMGLQFAKALEPYGLYWFEEPCWPESVDGLAEIQRAVATPIATGERLIGQHAFRELFDSARCSVLQPDITHCGGLSEARRIAALAEAYRVALAPHNPQGPVSTAASLEFGFATPSYIICESGARRRAVARRTWCSEGFTVEPKGRIVRPEPAPGPGHRDQRGRSEEASLPAGTICSACSTRTAAWAIGERGGVRRQGSGVREL